MSGKSENIIELKHISKVYSDNGFKAVDDFNLEVKRGEFQYPIRYCFMAHQDVERQPH